MALSGGGVPDETVESIIGVVAKLSGDIVSSAA